VVVVCCVVLFVASNPRLLLDILLFGVGAVGVRDLLFVFICLCVVFVMYLSVCSFPNIRVPLKVCSASRSVVYVFVVIRCCYLLLVLLS